MALNRNSLSSFSTNARAASLLPSLDYSLLARLFLLLFLGLADNQMIAALLPALVRSLHVSVGKAGILVVVYSLGAGVAAFLSGKLSDHYGRRRFLLAGVIIFSLASALAFRAQSFGGLLAARALTGLGAGTLSTCSIAFAGDWFPYAVRGRAIGLISTAYFAAPILGVPLAAQVADRFGWRHSFLMFALLGLAVTLISLTIPREARNQESVPARLAGTIRVFQAFLARRDTSAALVIAFLVSGGLVGFLTYLGQWLHSHFGISTRGIGWVFMLGGLVAVAGSPLGGILSDRLGKRTVALASNVVLALAIAVVPFFSWGVWLLILFCIASLSTAFRQGPLTALITELVSQHQRGLFVALHNIASQLGIALAVLTGGLLYERHGYFAVTTLCATMTGLVAILLATHIVEPQPEGDATSDRYFY
jgi:predicted MFS family arabinose efflux permease